MNHKTALIVLHIIVFLFGFTAILGKLISFESISLVWWRLIIVSISLTLFVLLRKKPLSLNRQIFGELVIVGCIVGLHWILFFAGIKIANIAITMIAISSGTLFTAIIEPLFFRRKLDWRECLIGLLIIIAIGLITWKESGQVENEWWGIFFGCSAALTASIFSTWNGKLIRRTNAVTISWLELIFASIWVTVALFLFNQTEGIFDVTLSDGIYLGVLGIVCTAVPFVLSVEVMKKLTPFTVNLAINLEIVYAIILGAVIFGESEKMSPFFYVGTVIIIALIGLNEWLKRRANKALARQ